MQFNNSCDGCYSSADVRFTKSCDNNCAFCIEKTGIDSLGKTDETKIAKSIIASGIRDVLILGGEPFVLVKKLANLVILIRPHVDRIYITTSLPRTITLDDPNVLAILDSIDGLNISLQSTDYKENNYLLRAKSNHNRIDILRQLNTRYADKIRVSINLVRGGIDNKERLLSCLDKLASIGCKHVKLNELQNSDLYVSYEKIMGVCMKSPYAHGCQTYLTPYKGMRILLKRSCFFTEDSLDTSFLDLVKVVWKKLFYRSRNEFAVVYEDGTISTHWRKR